MRTQCNLFLQEELAAYEAGETFVQFFIVQLDGLLNSFKNSLSPRNYDALVSILATEVTIQLERAIKKISFNRVCTLSRTNLPCGIRIIIDYVLFKSLAVWCLIRKFVPWEVI